MEFHHLAEKGRLKRIRGFDTVTDGGGVGTLLISNDKNNVAVKNVLSYFLCLSSNFEV